MVIVFFYLIFFVEAPSRCPLFWRNLFLAPTRSSARIRLITATSAAACAPRISGRSRTRSISCAQSVRTFASICRAVCRTKVCKLQVSILCSVADCRRAEQRAEQQRREDQRQSAETQKRRSLAHQVSSATADIRRRFSVSCICALALSTSFACRLLSDVVRGDRGQFVILGDGWKHKGANVRYVMRLVRDVNSIQTWRCVRKKQRQALHRCC